MNWMNKKFSVIFFVMMMVSFSATAQNNEVLHEVKSGESLSKLAQKYHTTVGDIMRANGMNSKSVLKIGKKIKIPTAANVAAPITTPIVTEPTKIIEKPITKKQIVADKKGNNFIIHVVEKKETLFSISKKYNITVSQLKQWNDLLSDNIHDNQKLIIMPQTKEQIAKNSAVVPEKIIEKKTALVVQQQAPVVAQTKPVVKNKPIEKQSAPLFQKQVPVQNEIAKDEKVKVAEMQTPPVVQQQAPVQTETKPVVITAAKDTVKQNIIAEKVETKPQAVKNVLPTFSASDADENEPTINLKNINNDGYFAQLYQKGKNELTGDAGTFKTASGWLDKKYYILINNIDAGTIVRVSVNNKSVFAKVLGPLPDVKEDNGLLLRICNAAATELGVGDSKFAVTVNY